MLSRSPKARTLALSITAITLVSAALAPPASAKFYVTFKRIAGYKSAGTPAKYNKVGILRIGSKKAKNVLVLNPGTSASASYFAPLAKDVVLKAKNWQVWAVERRENLLEDHSVFNRAKAGKANEQELFDYYLGWLSDSSITDHFRFISEDVSYARQWGMNTEIQDLRRVVTSAKKLGGKVVVGGHSLGGSITTAYATWDFNGKAGAKGLSGLVFIDGGSSPTPITTEEANQRLTDLQGSTPWLTFGDIPAPFTGLFNTSGALAVLQYPEQPVARLGMAAATGQPEAPGRADEHRPVRLRARHETSPAALAAAQAHLGRLAPSGDPRGWERAGELTPIRRYATMFSGWGLKSLDGTAWYHPQRLTIDSGAVAAGNANPAQALLGVRAIHGDDLSKRLRIYAFGAALGGQRVLDAAKVLASQSGIPKRNLKLVDRHETYSHNDPNSASPKNDFVKYLIPFLKKISRR